MHRCSSFPPWYPHYIPKPLADRAQLPHCACHVHSHSRGLHTVLYMTTRRVTTPPSFRHRHTLYALDPGMQVREPWPGRLLRPTTLSFAYIAWRQEGQGRRKGIPVSKCFARTLRILMGLIVDFQPATARIRGHPLRISYIFSIRAISIPNCCHQHLCHVAVTNQNLKAHPLNAPHFALNTSRVCTLHIPSPLALPGLVPRIRYRPRCILPRGNPSATTPAFDRRVQPSKAGHSPSEA